MSRNTGWTPRPEVTAMLDQASAAAGESDGIMSLIASAEGTSVMRAKPGPAARMLIARLAKRGRAGRLAMCPHLSYSSPSPAFWFPWSPQMIYCPRCGDAEQERTLRGTEEDRRCDRCLRIRPTIHTDMVQMPPIVADLGDGPAYATPPVMILYGLCPDCQRPERGGGS
jgi:hypothetical protein